MIPTKTTQSPSIYLATGILTEPIPEDVKAVEVLTKVWRYFDQMGELKDSYKRLRIPTAKRNANTLIAKRRRIRGLALMKQAAAYYIRNKTRLTWKQIGILLGHQHHATVMSNYGTWSDLRDVDPAVQFYARILEQVLAKYKDVTRKQNE